VAVQADLCYLVVQCRKNEGFLSWPATCFCTLSVSCLSGCGKILKSGLQFCISQLLPRSGAGSRSLDSSELDSELLHLIAVGKSRGRERWFSASAMGIRFGLSCATITKASEQVAFLATHCWPWCAHG